MDGGQNPRLADKCQWLWRLFLLYIRYIYPNYMQAADIETWQNVGVGVNITGTYTASRKLRVVPDTQESTVKPRQLGVWLWRQYLELV